MLWINTHNTSHVIESGVRLSHRRNTWSGRKRVLLYSGLEGAVPMCHPLGVESGAGLPLTAPGRAGVRSAGGTWAYRCLFRWRHLGVPMFVSLAAPGRADVGNTGGTWACRCWFHRLICTSHTQHRKTVLVGSEVSPDHIQ